MVEKLLSILFFLAAWALPLKAQDYPVSMPDGTPLSVKSDSISVKPDFSPLPDFFPIQGIRMPSYLTPVHFETKEERAARINLRTEAGVKLSVKQNLFWYRPPVFSPVQKAMFFVAGLFLTSPSRLPDGCIPAMNASNPFFFYKTPGMAPVEHPYAPEFFPQCIRTEYDFASGTYKQMMVPWSEFNMNLNRSFGGPYLNAPVPRMYFNSAERALLQ